MLVWRLAEKMEKKKVEKKGKM
jgi:hypothetical protein